MRGENGQHKMTLKTAGIVIIGLYQHPEYNMPLAKANLDIRLLLPADMQQQEVNEALAKALHLYLVSMLFSIHFQRKNRLLLIAKA
ncbi:MAG: hypothetical protein ACSLEM_06825 [Candidatus Malihini olakiniferum]